MGWSRVGRQKASWPDSLGTPKSGPAAAKSTSCAESRPKPCSVSQNPATYVRATPPPDFEAALPLSRLPQPPTPHPTSVAVSGPKFNSAPLGAFKRPLSAARPMELPWAGMLQPRFEQSSGGIRPERGSKGATATSFYRRSRVASPLDHHTASERELGVMRNLSFVYGEPLEVRHGGETESQILEFTQKLHAVMAAGAAAKYPNIAHILLSAAPASGSTLRHCARTFSTITLLTNLGVTSTRRLRNSDHVWLDVGPTSF